MGYVAVKGGREAIEASLERIRYERLRSRRILAVADARGGLNALLDQVMSESSLYAPSVAALAVTQAEGSPEEAVFLMRAFRSTLSRAHYSCLADGRDMRVHRRISACFKEIPGGQLLGASCDYTHRLVDFDLREETLEEALAWLDAYLARPVELAPGDNTGGDNTSGDKSVGGWPVIDRVSDYLRREGLLKGFAADDTPPLDVTKRMLGFPAQRSERLQVLARAQTGALTALGYAALRGYGALHPTVGELRVGMLSIHVPDPRNPHACQDDSYYVGEIRVTEVETLIPVTRDLGQGKKDIEFEIGYGVCFGQNETKAIAMSLIDQCLQTGNPEYPTHDEEFVLMHVDSVEATGFISHLKLPHYVTFQSKLDSVRKTRKATAQAGAPSPSPSGEGVKP